MIVTTIGCIAPGAPLVGRSFSRQHGPHLVGFMPEGSASPSPTVFLIPWRLDARNRAPHRPAVHTRDSCAGRDLASAQAEIEAIAKSPRGLARTHSLRAAYPTLRLQRNAIREFARAPAIHSHCRFC